MSLVAEELRRIYDERGQLTPELVVEEARDIASPLHASIEWDDAVAGPAWRLVQARRLIASVKVTVIGSSGPEGFRVREFHHIGPDGDGERTYMPADRVALDPVARAVVLRQLRVRLVAAMRACSDVEGALAVLAEVAVEFEATKAS